MLPDACARPSSRQPLRLSDAPRPVAGRQREPSIPLTAPPSAAQRSLTACGWGSTNAARPLLLSLPPWLNRVGVLGRPCPPLAVRAAPGQAKPNRSACPSPPTSLRSRTRPPGAGIPTEALSSKRRAVENIQRNQRFRITDAKKMAVTRRAAFAFRRHFAISHPKTAFRRASDRISIDADAHQPRIAGASSIGQGNAPPNVCPGDDQMRLRLSRPRAITSA